MTLQLISKSELKDFRQSLLDVDPSMTKEDLDASVNCYMMFIGNMALENPEDFGLV